jgi:hypothetical protein
MNVTFGLAIFAAVMVVWALVMNHTLKNKQHK